MDKGYININEVEMNNINSHLSRSISSISSVGNESSSSFSSLNRANLYGDGINKINRQINSIANSVSNIRQIIENSNQEMTDAENMLASRAESIEIPKDFVTKDSVKSNLFNEITLSKNDGRSVNEGQELTDDKEEFTSSVTYDNNLKNIKNSNMIESNNIKDINLNKVSLSDVSNDLEVRENLLQFDETLNKENLSNIGNDFRSQVQDVDTNTIIKKSDILNNFNNTNTDTVDFNMNI